MPVVALPGDVPALPTGTTGPWHHAPVAPNSGSSVALALRRRVPVHDGRRRRVDGGHCARPPARPPRDHRAPEWAPARSGAPDRAGERTSCGYPSTAPSRSTSRRVDDRRRFTACSAASTTPGPPVTPAGVADGPWSCSSARRRPSDVRPWRRATGARRLAGRHRRRQRAVVRRERGQPLGHVECVWPLLARADVVVAGAGWGVVDAVAAGVRLALVPEPATVRRADHSGRRGSRCRRVGRRASSVASCGAPGAGALGRHAPRARRGRRSTTGTECRAPLRRSIGRTEPAITGVSRSPPAATEHLARLLTALAAQHRRADEPWRRWPSAARPSPCVPLRVERVVVEREAGVLPLGAARNGGRQHLDCDVTIFLDVDLLPPLSPTTTVSRWARHPDALACGRVRYPQRGVAGGRTGSRPRRAQRAASRPGGLRRTTSSTRTGTSRPGP